MAVHDRPAQPDRTRGFDRALARIQALTGLAFAGFVLVHLVTITAALLGPGTANAVLSLGRRVYQIPAIEAGMLGCLVVHIAVGLARWRLRARKSSKPTRNATTRAHRISGRVLAVVLVGHVLATRGPTWFFGLPVDLSLVSFTLENYGWVFYPYYTALFAFGAFHMVRGAQVALAQVRAPVPNAWLRMSGHGWRPWALGFAALALATLLCLGGLLYPVDRSSYPALEALFKSEN